MLSHAAPRPQLNTKPFGTRGGVIDIPSLIKMERIAHPEGALCQPRRAQARCAGVVCRLVMRIARYAGCGTKARRAERPFWAA